MHSFLWPIWSVLSISPELFVLCSVGILSVNWPRRPASYSVLFPLEKPLIWEMTFINVSSSNFSWRGFLARCGDHICSIWLPPAELGRIAASQEGWRGAQWFQRAKFRRKWVHLREFFREICQTVSYCGSTEPPALQTFNQWKCTVYPGNAPLWLVENLESRWLQISPQNSVNVLDHNFRFRSLHALHIQNLSNCWSYK